MKGRQFYRHRNRGSNASRAASPRKLKANTVTLSAAAGAMRSQGAQHVLLAIDAQHPAPGCVAADDPVCTRNLRDPDGDRGNRQTLAQYGHPDECWDGRHPVHDSLQYEIGSGAKTAHHAQDEPAAGADSAGGNPDRQRDPCSIDDATEDIPPERIRAEEIEAPGVVVGAVGFRGLRSGWRRANCRACCPGAEAVTLTGRSDPALRAYPLRGWALPGGTRC